MTITTRRFAAVALTAFAPLAAVSIATAAPSSAQCEAGQTDFNGSCVASTCKKDEVRDPDSGACRNALSAALGKASPPAVSQLKPEQWQSAAQIAQQAGAIPSAPATVGTVMGIVNTAVDIPVSVAAAASDTTDTLYFLAQLAGGAGGGTGGALRTASSGATAFSTAADVARSLPSPGLPKLPPPPNLGNPVDVLKKLPSPKIGPPRLLGLCGPKMLFFKPCI